MPVTEKIYAHIEQIDALSKSVITPRELQYIHEFGHWGASPQEIIIEIGNAVTIFEDVSDSSSVAVNWDDFRAKMHEHFGGTRFIVSVSIL